MLFALVVMAGVLLLAMVFNSRRRPSRWDDRFPRPKDSRPPDGSGGAFDGGFGVDCGADGGGGGG
jgi:hypothetical protein